MVVGYYWRYTPFQLLMRYEEDPCACWLVSDTSQQAQGRVYSEWSAEALYRLTSANYIVATPHRGARALKFENDADETSRTAGRQLYYPQTL